MGETFTLKDQPCDRDGASKRWLLLFDTSGCMLVGSRDREIEM